MNIRKALRSVESGIWRNASPAKVTSAMRSPCNRSASRLSSWRARSMRLGATSSASIDAETSSAITRSSPLRVTSFGVDPNRGPASAMVSVAMLITIIAERTRRRRSSPSSARRSVVSAVPNRCRSRRCHARAATNSTTTPATPIQAICAMGLSHSIRARCGRWLGSRAPRAGPGQARARERGRNALRIR